MEASVGNNKTRYALYFVHQFNPRKETVYDLVYKIKAISCKTKICKSIIIKK
jgi:hypothetical protein